MCKYSDFKGANNSNCNVQSILLSKGLPTATVMRKYSDFKGVSGSNCNA